MPAKRIGKAYTFYKVEPSGLAYLLCLSKAEEAHSVYLSRIKMLIGTPEKSQFSRILFSKKRL